MILNRPITTATTSPPRQHATLPTAWIVARAVGESSEPWLYRQVIGFRRVRPHVVCWQRKNESAYPLDDVPVDVLPFEPRPDDGRGRWQRRLRNVAHGNYYGALGAEFRALELLLRKTRPQMALCHFGYSALRLLPLARKHGLPVVAHFHGLDVSSGLRNRWYRASLLRMLPHFAAIVVVGSHQRQWMLDHGVEPARVHLIPCGVPTAEFSIPPTRSQSEPLRFVCVSRLVRWKGVAETIHAFSRVHNRGVRSQLHVVGDGPERERLEELTRELDLGPSVVFHGSLPPAQVHEILCRSDVFVQHSLTDVSGWVEGFGVSIAEAAAVGLPVIATRSGGILDQVLDGRTGLLVPERDVDAMADAMFRLAADPLLRIALGATGRRRMVEHFDTELQIAKLEDVMLDTLTPRSTSVIDAPHADRQRPLCSVAGVAQPGG